jgi:hypothetical protein
MSNADMPLALRDQTEAAIRHAEAWVDTNEHVSGWMASEDLPAAYWLLRQAWLDSDPDIPCPHITGPQPVHWFTIWPQHVWCNSCAVRRMRRSGRAKRPCLGCGEYTAGVGELVAGNLVAHGPVCTGCGSA